MPYSGIGDASLPPNVKKMPANKRKAFVEAFNSAMSSGKGESYAFPVAQAAAKKAGASKKDYLTNWGDVDSRQVSQEDADYDPVGGMKHGEMACANCHWWVSPNSCLLVRGSIAPTGLSKFWMVEADNDEDDQKPVPMYEVDAPTSDDDGDADDEYQPYTMPLMGKGKERNIVQTVVDGVKSLFAPAIIVKEIGSGANRMVFFKDAKSGQLRFITTVSNNFRDREGEVIPESAHKEFVDWATTNKSYPELWLWHSGPGSKWGQVDMLDVVDGFLVESGLVEKGKEYIANNLAAMSDPVGVSHGFVSLKEGSTIVRYRSFETSPLLLSSAANEWTDFTTIQKEGSMPFTKQKRDFLLGAGMTPDAVSTLEKSLEGLSKELKSRGVDWKEFEPGVKATNDTSGDETDVWGNPITKEVTNAHKTKPADYADVPDDKFLDKANWKYPFDEKHIKAAESYFNHEGQQKAGGYSDSQWAAMGGKLASALGADYKYEGGKVVHTDKALDGVTTKEYKALDDRITGLDTKISGVEAAVKEFSDEFKAAMVKLTMSDDKKTSEFFKAQVANLPKGYQASEAGDNKGVGNGATAARIKEAVEKQNPALTFFDETIMGGMTITNG